MRLVDPEPDPTPSRAHRLDHLTDGRVLGEWPSRYPARAWAWIFVELLYLTVGLSFSLCLLYQIAAVAHTINGPLLWPRLFSGLSRSTLALGAISISGASGGFAFALKWLYHGVAYGKWHRDRLIWRLVVPILSAVLALFTALMIGSGIVPFFNASLTEAPRGGAAFGFFVGFFSDNLLAALQRLADQALGTLGRVEEKPNPPPKS